MKKIFYSLIIMLTLSVLLNTQVYAEDAAGPVETTEPEEKTENADVSADEPFDMIAYVEGTLIPAAAAVITSAGALYLLATPLIKRIKNVVALLQSACGLFNGATKRVKNADDENEATKAELKAMREDICFIKTHLANVEEIERIGFGNMKELVQNGKARQIGKVGKDENTD